MISFQGTDSRKATHPWTRTLPRRPVLRRALRNEELFCRNESCQSSSLSELAVESVFTCIVLVEVLPVMFSLSVS